MIRGEASHRDVPNMGVVGAEKTVLQEKETEITPSHH